MSCVIVILFLTEFSPKLHLKLSKLSIFCMVMKILRWKHFVPMMNAFKFLYHLIRICGFSDVEILNQGWIMVLNLELYCLFLQVEPPYSVIWYSTVSDIPPVCHTCSNTCILSPQSMVQYVFVLLLLSSQKLLNVFGIHIAHMYL